jgi:CHAT domain-containing protein
MCVKRGNYAQAQASFQRAFDLLLHQFQNNFTYMTEKDRLSFMDTVSALFQEYFRFVSRYHEKDPQLVGSMYDVLLWQKGFIASSVASMRRQIEASGDQEALKLLAELASKRTQLAALLNTIPPDRAEWRKQVDQLRAESDALEKELVEKSSSFAQQKRLERATWQQVRDALKPGEAAVEFARFNADDPKQPTLSDYVALVVTSETRDEPRFIPLGDSKQIEGDAVTSFERSTQTRGFVEPSKAASLPGAQAYEFIVKPLEPALVGKTRVYLSPDGILNQIPIGVIPAPDGKLLMERYDLRLMSSTKDILREPAAPGPKAALLVGDPMFSLTAEQQAAAVRRLSSHPTGAHAGTAALEQANQSLDLARDLARGTTLPPLPGTGAEVMAIAGLMQSDGWKATAYTQELALKQIVEQAGSERVIHLATHGFFLPDEEKQPATPARSEPRHAALEDPMLRSGLYFSGANRTLAGRPTPAGLDNGVLTALEAGNLNLTGTELVVLSACNTGQGDVHNGEGVFGLRRALQEAGAQDVMMSLWSVPDKETLELMKIFYSKWLSGTEKHEALKQAQLEMRERVKQEHDGKDLPYYWGAFVMVGN